MNNTIEQYVTLITELSDHYKELQKEKEDWIQNYYGGKSWEEYRDMYQPYLMEDIANKEKKLIELIIFIGNEYK